VKDQTLARRYAEALFLAALERDDLDRVTADVSGAAGLIKDDPKLQHFLESPEILTADKERVVRSVFEERSHPLVADLILLLLHKQRVPYLPDVMDLYLRRVEEHRGIIRARVLTPFPLSDDLKEKLRRRLEEKTGKKVDLAQKIEKNLIGGVTVIVGDKILDGSLRHELDELRRQLLETELPDLEAPQEIGA
jgi:ATP synthase F1 delta subunit